MHHLEVTSLNGYTAQSPMATAEFSAKTGEWCRLKLDLEEAKQLHD